MLEGSDQQPQKERVENMHHVKGKTEVWFDFRIGKIHDLATKHESREGFDLSMKFGTNIGQQERDEMKSRR